MISDQATSSRESIRDSRLDPVTTRGVVVNARDQRTHIRRISWGAVLGGVAAAMSIQLMLTVLGMGIGMAAIEPASGNDPGAGMAIGAGIWWFVTGLLALFVGGVVAGRLAGLPNVMDSTLHGMLVWAVAGIVGVVVLTTSAAGLLAGAAGPLSRVIASRVDTADTRGVLGNAAAGLERMGDEAIRQADRGTTARRDGSGAAVPGTARDPGAGADGTVRDTADRIERAANEPAVTDDGQRTTRARAAADDAADGLASAALWSFFALLLGAIAASAGGMLARPPAVFGADPALV